MNLSKLIKFVMLLPVCYLASISSVLADGCTGSTFTLTYSPVCGCVQFCDGGTGAGTIISDCNDFNSLVIDWGDGSTPFNIPLVNGQADALNLPCHHYAAGTYTAVLRIDGNCKGGIFQLPRNENFCNIPYTFTVAPYTVTLESNFIADTVCLGEAMSFTSLANFSAELIGREWFYDFGDGTTSSGSGAAFANPMHTYTGCGAFDVMLVVSATTVCCNDRSYDTIIRRVYVDCPPNVNSNALGNLSPYIYESFGSSTADTVCLGDPTSFVLTASDSIIEWFWRFNVDSTSTDHDPTFTFLGCSDDNNNFATLTLTNTRGCSSSADYPIWVHCPIVDVPLLANNVLCNGDANGSIIVSPQGGTPPYEYIWAPTGQTSSVASGLSGGYHSVTVADANDCEFVIDSTFIIEPDEFIGTLSIDSIFCNGWSTGTAVLLMQGGTAPVTYEWSPISDTSPSPDSLPAGTYYVTATDANGCIWLDTADIVEPPEIIATVSSTTTACGTCNATATVVASGGTGDYTYLWDANAGSQTTATAVGLCAGLYTVEVIDSNVLGCSKFFAVAVTNLGSEVITANSTDVTCYGDCDGTATVNLPACTNPPCNIEWYDDMGIPIGQTTATANNLCVGDYTVRVVNDIGCESFATVTVGGPDDFTSTLNVQNISCPGQCDGQITAVINGGTMTYTYQWFNAGSPVGGNSPNINGLCAGTYQLSVTDANNCTAAFGVTIPDYSLNTSVTSTNITCNGQCTGSIVVTASGTFPPFTYQWLDTAGDSIIGETTPSISNLCAGSYTVIVADNNGCNITTSPVVITEPTPVSVNVSVIDLQCYDDCSGVATATASGGTPSYSYLWADSSMQQMAGYTSATAAGLCAGTYYVKAKDDNNCSSPWVQLIVNQPPLLQDSLIVTQPHCANNGLGCIQAVAYGGTSGYTYTWSTGDVTSGICDLPLGEYSVVIIDANGCIVTDTATIDSVPPLSLVSIEDWGWVVGSGQGTYDERCYGDSMVVAVVEVTGGQPPYTYTWNDPNQTSTTTTATIDSVTELPAGTFIVVITDATGCSVDTSITVTQPPPLDVSHTFIDVACYGDSTGSILVTVSGGVPDPMPPGYSFRWTRIDTNHIFSRDPDPTGLPAGQYVVAIRDSYQCAIRDTVTIDEPTLLEITTTVTGVTCNNGSDGTLAASVTGGVPPYAFSWNSGQYDTSHVSGVSAGQYIVVATDSNGCTISDTVIVAEPVPIGDSIIGTDITCFDGADGTVDLTVFYGVEPYSWSWNNGAYNTEDLTGVPAGEYSVIITDSNGCIATDTIVLSEPPFISTVEPVQRCEGETYFFGGVWYSNDTTVYDTLISINNCDSAVTLNLSFVEQIFEQDSFNICQGQSIIVGGDVIDAAGTYYDTTLSVGLCDSVTETKITITPTTYGTWSTTICEGETLFVSGTPYTTMGTIMDTVISSSNCDSVVTITLNVTSLGLIGESDTVCEGATTSFTAQAGFDEYDWSGLNNNTPTATVGVGTYELIVTDYASGCTATATYVVEQEAPLDLYTMPDSLVLIGGLGAVIVEILSGNNMAIQSYTWSNFEDGTCLNPECSQAELSPEQEQVYTVTALSDPRGCPETITFTVYVDYSASVMIPNIFTPNNDGNNDDFKPFVTGWSTYRMTIFDRWGEKIFETDDVNEGWDGTFKGEPVPPDVYVYYLDIVFIEGETPQNYSTIRKGSVTLVR